MNEMIASIGRHETDDLISSEKVQGTNVYNLAGEKLGRLEHFMVGKRDGRVRYAVLTFGGVLGLFENHYPLPWDALKYDEERSGYVVNLTREQIEGAPSYKVGREPAYDASYGQQIYGFYGFPW
ncbi:PRC-barrel domain-containing protein [Novosphingobium sp. G106]|uniref:PRC-barrel domain-containing protein n=1 Tax=Novosphingobium sp. G106 TaxID=2849500 RepID=UPI001C2D6230|nr:PRC-barrel domain-containing protein [Novosphingobium sp. G106]MBV1691358.1 PRC-barrel domain-containing protein [Novosphingobium sp. G106]